MLKRDDYAQHSGSFLFVVVVVLDWIRIYRSGVQARACVYTIVQQYIYIFIITFKAYAELGVDNIYLSA